MLLPRSNSLAKNAPKKRARLAARWVIPVFLIAACASLIILFPREAETRLQALAAHDDLVATEYLRSVLSQHPNDFEVRFELAERAIRAGDKATALALLTRMNEMSRAQKAQAIKLAFGIQEIDLLSHAKSNPNYLSALSELQKILNHALDASDGKNIDSAWLIEKFNIYQPERTPLLYQKMATLDTGRAPYWLEQNAKYNLAHGLYSAAADAYFEAMQKSRDPAHARGYFMAGLRTLQSGNLSKEALAAAERYGAPYLNERDMLIYLVRLARSLGRYETADRYARQLVRLSLLERMSPIQAASWRDRPLVAEGPLRFIRSTSTPKLPFDEEAYTLAYEVFIDNKKFEDAMAMVQAALKEKPNNAIWMKRLAHLCEWSGKMEQALDAWRNLALKHNDKEAWAAMARLAPGLLADEDLLLLWQKEIAQRPLNDKEWLELKFVYERLARPLDGAALFEQQFNSSRNPLFLEQAAYLRESSGDLNGALANYRLLAQILGARPKWALPEAALLYSQNQLDAALDALNNAKSLATKEDYHFWRVLGELAWSQDRRDLAKEAYQQRQTAPDWQNDDTDRLLNLLDAKDLEAQLAISRAAWQRSRNIDFLNIALNILLDRQQVQEANQLLLGMTRPEIKQALSKPEFLAQRARYYLLVRDWAHARADLALADQLRPSADIKNSLLWLMIDSRDIASLRETLPRWEMLVAENPTLAEPIASAWLTLGNVQRALRWSTPLLAAHKNDSAWLSNYADMLRQSGQTDAATQLQQGLWLRQHQNKASDIHNLLQQLRLALQFEPIDQAEAKLFRALLGSHSLLNHSAANNARDAERLNELAYAWFNSAADDNRARFWHWRRYAKKQLDPAFAAPTTTLSPQSMGALHSALHLQSSMQLTLPSSMPRTPTTQPESDASNAQPIDAGVMQFSIDLATPTESLSRDAQRQQRQVILEALEPFDRNDTAYGRGERGVALSEAWAQLSGAPNNDALHLQFADQWLGQRPSGIHLRNEYQGGDLAGWRQTLQHNNRIAPQLQLSVQLDSAQRSWDKQSYSQNDRGIDISLSRLYGDDDALQLTLGQRKAWTDTTSAVLRSEGRHYQWHYAAEYAWNRPTNDSNALSLAGMQRQLWLEGGYLNRSNLDSRIRISQATILTQNGLDLGTRQQGEISLYWASQQRGGWSAELLTQRTVYQLTPYLLTPLNTDLPSSFTRINATLGYGMVYKDAYTRAWRPFASATLGHHSINGQENSWQMGIAGSVLGKDHLSLYGGSALQNGGSSSAFAGLYYQWLY